MSTLIADFGLYWGRGGVGGVRGQLLRGPEKGCWEVEVVHCVTIHILQAHISVPGQKSDTFSHESSGFWDQPDSLLFLPPTLSTLLPWNSAFPSSTSCFLWSTSDVLCSSPLWSTHLEGDVVRGAHYTDNNNKSNGYTWNTGAHTGTKTSCGNSWPWSAGHRA